MKVGTESGTVYADTDSVINTAKKVALNKQYGMFVTGNSLIEHRIAMLYKRVPDFKPYLQRVFNEAQELNNKICKLRKYLLEKKESDNPLEVREEAFQRQQLVFMEGYLEMLLCRMEMWC